MTTPSAQPLPFTEQLLVDAGIEHGMRVVDLGCGGGEVTCLVAKLVGPNGRVLGVDRDGPSIARARENAQSKGVSNAVFVHQDLSQPLPEPHAFDGIVARRVLMYLPSPADTLRPIVRALREGGLAVFQEADATMTPGRHKPFPLHDRVNGWIWGTVAREGANLHMGFDLPALLQDAGLRVLHLRAAAEIEGYGTGYSLAAIARAMQGRIVQHGVATEAELDLDTLETRLAAERIAVGAPYVPSMSFGAWARKP